MMQDLGQKPWHCSCDITIIQVMDIIIRVNKTEQKGSLKQRLNWRWRPHLQSFDLEECNMNKWNISSQPLRYHGFRYHVHSSDLNHWLAIFSESQLDLKDISWPSGVNCTLAQLALFLHIMVLLANSLSKSNHSVQNLLSKDLMFSEAILV